MRLAAPQLLLSALLLPTPWFAATTENPASLDRAYRLMYSLDFPASKLEFSKWQREHPAEPLGPVSEAANLLFSEFDRLGILEAQFFVDDSSFTSHRKVSPDLGLKTRFDSDLHRAETMARQRLAGNARDRDALFAIAMVYGLRADYSALVENRNMTSLWYRRQGSEWASRLLAIAPDYYDAYVAGGISDYIVGSLAAPVRWFLRLSGFNGNKTRGLEELKLTAERGRFLAPFARILLAIAYLRERDRAQARKILVGLRNDFPSNPLFAREISSLDALPM